MSAGYEVPDRAAVTVRTRGADGSYTRGNDWTYPAGQVIEVVTSHGAVALVGVGLQLVALFTGEATVSIHPPTDTRSMSTGPRQPPTPNG